MSSVCDLDDSIEAGEAVPSLRSRVPVVRPFYLIGEIVLLLGTRLPTGRPSADALPAGVL